MSFEINRITGLDLESLVTRPRVSHAVSEFVFLYLNENLLVPKRILQSEKYHYRMVLSFSRPIPRPNKILYRSPFATATRLYIPEKGFRTVNRTEKWAFLSVVADDIDQSITPYEYSNVVFYMLTDFFIYNFKSVGETDFESLRLGMDRKRIERFPFPAPFEDQKYTIDTGKFSHDWESYQKLGDSALTSVKDEYLKHYPY
ncbi:MAG: hypothetical protein H7Y31_07805 [Chitinophagaceae bacterium]|nr:hypothetical protein [Chitinophagaceae bacterium]